MSAEIQETKVNGYQKLLAPEGGTEVKERQQKQASFIAFFGHLHALGRKASVVPNLVKGTTQISIPAYFALEGHGDNPINGAALKLLPKYPRDHFSSEVNLRGLNDALWLPDNSIEAARKSKASSYTVAKALDLIEPESKFGNLSHELTRLVSPWDHSHDRSRLAWDEIEYVHNMRGFLSRISDDFDGRVVGEVGDVAASVREKGYVDFLDYLVDVRQVLDERVATIFSHDAPNLPA